MSLLKLGSVFLMLILTSLSSWAGNETKVLNPSTLNSSADQIFKEVEKHVNSKDESAKIVMTITEANGSKKTREMEVLRKSGESPKVMVKLQSPPDLRGTALLSIGGKGKAEEQWLYLPSSKQTRRIVSSNKNSSFLDSEMSYEDMGSSSDKKFTNKILRTENTPKGPLNVIESTLVSGDSSYSKMLTWVSTDPALVNRIEYYDLKGTLLKTTEMSDYKKFSGDIWRAQNILVSNAQNHRSTQLQLKDISINKGIPDSEFSENSMGAD